MGFCVSGNFLVYYLMYSCMHFMTVLMFSFNADRYYMYYHPVITFIIGCFIVSAIQIGVYTIIVVVSLCSIF